MIQNPFKKKDNLAQKVTRSVQLPKLPHLTKQKTTKQKVGEWLQLTLIWLAFFIAGFVLSKIHTLMVVGN